MEFLKGSIFSIQSNEWLKETQMEKDKVSLFLPDGAQYEGEWKNGLPNGQGVINHANGAQYSGSFIDG